MSAAALALTKLESRTNLSLKVVVVGVALKRSWFKKSCYMTDTEKKIRRKRKKSKETAQNVYFLFLKELSSYSVCAFIMF